MAEEIKYIQLRDEGGVKILPKTLGKLVINNAGSDLGTVEAGAQVNKLEKIKVNGTELTIVNKTANIEIPAAAEYGLASGTPEDGFQSTYFLTKDGVELAGSARINVAKDQFLKAGSVKLCKATDEPIEGLKIGDAYIDLELQENDEHIYIPAKDLVNNYLAGTGIIVDANKIAIDETVVATKAFVEDLDSVKSGITSEKVATYEAHVANANIHVTTEDKAIWSAKQDALNAEQLKAVNSGITAEKLAELEAFADGKQDKLTDEQLAAVNSGFTADDKSVMDAHISIGEIKDNDTVALFHFDGNLANSAGGADYEVMPNSYNPVIFADDSKFGTKSLRDNFICNGYILDTPIISDFTVEFFAKNTKSDALTMPLTVRTGALNTDDYLVFSVSGSESSFYWSSNTLNNPVQLNPTQLNDTEWHHYAYCYKQTTGRVAVYIDGILHAESNVVANKDVAIQAINAFDNSYNIWRINEFRISRVCRYNSNFTVPTAPFTIGGTSDSEIHVTTENKASWNSKVNTNDYESDQIVVDETLESHEDADRELNQLVLFYELVENGTEEPSDEVTTTVDIPEGATIEFKEIA